MISAYPADATDFTTNGLGALDPISCMVHEILNGIYDVTLVYPIDDERKWQRLALGNILRVPVPAATTPTLSTVGTPASSTDIYEVQTDGRRLNMRAQPSLTARIIHAYSPGTEVISLGEIGDWREVAAPDGAHGFMWASNLVFVRTEETGSAAEGQVVEERQLRDQPFRIYAIEPGMSSITVRARHIWYDLADNLLMKYAPVDAYGATVASQILALCEDEHGFRVYSDLDTTGSAEWLHANPVDAFLGESGFVDTWGGELVRDWYDMFVVQAIGRDRGVTIRYGKNLTGISGSESLDNVATRIVPTGKDEDGEILYLPEVYVDSLHIAEYPHTRWAVLDVADAVEGDYEDENGNPQTRTLEQCYELMRAAVQAEYDAGVDLPEISLQVDFVHLPNTMEYANFQALQDIFLGDTVTVIHDPMGMQAKLRMIEYEYDCLTEQYTRISLGSAAATTASIAPRQIPTGGISGTKLARNSVSMWHLTPRARNALMT